MNYLTQINKSVLLYLFITLLLSCSSDNSKNVTFVDGQYLIDIEANNKLLTSMCKVSLKGKSDCDLKLSLSGVNSICIPKGEINFWRNYEWFDNKRKIKLIQKDGCAGSSNLIFDYEFSFQYFGKGKGEGFSKCNVINKDIRLTD